MTSRREKGVMQTGSRIARAMPRSNFIIAVALLLAIFAPFMLDSTQIATAAPELNVVINVQVDKTTPQPGENVQIIASTFIDGISVLSVTAFGDVIDPFNRTHYVDFTPQNDGTLRANFTPTALGEHRIIASVQISSTEYSNTTEFVATKPNLDLKAALENLDLENGLITTRVTYDQSVAPNGLNISGTLVNVKGQRSIAGPFDCKGTCSISAELPDLSSVKAQLAAGEQSGLEPVIGPYAFIANAKHIGYDYVTSFSVGQPVTGRVPEQVEFEFNPVYDKDERPTFSFTPKDSSTESSLDINDFISGIATIATKDSLLPLPPQKVDNGVVFRSPNLGVGTYTFFAEIVKPSSESRTSDTSNDNNQNNGLDDSSSVDKEWQLLKVSFEIKDLDHATRNSYVIPAYDPINGNDWLYLEPTLPPNVMSNLIDRAVIRVVDLDTTDLREQIGHVLVDGTIIPIDFDANANQFLLDEAIVERIKQSSPSGSFAFEIPVRKGASVGGLTISDSVRQIEMNLSTVQEGNIWTHTATPIRPDSVPEQTLIRFSIARDGLSLLEAAWTGAGKELYTDKREIVSYSSSGTLTVVKGVASVFTLISDDTTIRPLWLAQDATTELSATPKTMRFIPASPVDILPNVTVRVEDPTQLGNVKLFVKYTQPGRGIGLAELKRDDQGQLSAPLNYTQGMRLGPNAPLTIEAWTSQGSPLPVALLVDVASYASPTPTRVRLTTPETTFAGANVTVAFGVENPFEVPIKSIKYKLINPVGTPVVDHTLSPDQLIAIDNEVGFNFNLSEGLGPGEYSIELKLIDVVNRPAGRTITLRLLSSTPSLTFSPDYSISSEPNSEVILRHTVVNNNFRNSDVVDFETRSIHATVLLFDEKGRLLSDNNLDGRPDSGIIGPGKSFTLEAHVLIPPDATDGLETVRIRANSNQDPTLLATVRDDINITVPQQLQQDISTFDDVDVFSISVDKYGTMSVLTRNNADQEISLLLQAALRSVDTTEKTEIPLTISASQETTVTLPWIAPQTPYEIEVNLLAKDGSPHIDTKPENDRRLLLAGGPWKQGYEVRVPIRVRERRGILHENYILKVPLNFGPNYDYENMYIEALRPGLQAPVLKPFKYNLLAHNEVQGYATALIGIENVRPQEEFDLYVYLPRKVDRGSQQLDQGTYNQFWDPAIILDNGNPDVSLHGNWLTDYSIPGFYGFDYLVDVGIGGAGKAVIYQPRLPVGRYELYLWHPTDVSFASNAHVVIKAMDGEWEFIVNQRHTGGRWEFFGMYPMDETSTVSIIAGKTDGFVVADAIKFLPIEQYTNKPVAKGKDQIAGTLADQIQPVLNGTYMPGADAIGIGRLPGEDAVEDGITQDQQGTRQDQTNQGSRSGQGSQSGQGERGSQSGDGGPDDITRDGPGSIGPDGQPLDKTSGANADDQDAKDALDQAEQAIEDQLDQGADGEGERDKESATPSDGSSERLNQTIQDNLQNVSTSDIDSSAADGSIDKSDSQGKVADIVGAAKDGASGSGNQSGQEQDINLSGLDTNASTSDLNGSLNGTLDQDQLGAYNQSQNASSNLVDGNLSGQNGTSQGSEGKVSNIIGPDGQPLNQQNISDGIDYNDSDLLGKDGVREDASVITNLTDEDIDRNILNASLREPVDVPIPAEEVGEGQQLLNQTDGRVGKPVKRIVIPIDGTMLADGTFLVEIDGRATDFANVRDVLLGFSSFKTAALDGRIGNQIVGGAIQDERILYTSNISAEQRRIAYIFDPQPELITAVRVTLLGYNDERWDTWLPIKLKFDKNFDLDEPPSSRVNFKEQMNERNIRPNIVLSVASFASGRSASSGLLSSRVEDLQGNVVLSSNEVSDLGGDIYNITVSPKRAMKPGIYKLITQTQVNGQSLLEEEWFTWGLVSVNTLKPLYHPGDLVDIVSVVLDANGYTVPGATVDITVSGPGFSTSLSTNDGSLVNSSEREGVFVGAISNGFPNIGTYHMDVIADTGLALVNISSTVRAQQSFPYDIVRDVPATIDPNYGPYYNGITIDALNGITSIQSVKEIIPAQFAVTSSNADELLTVGDEKHLIWNNYDITLGNNENELYYEAQTPLITPYLYNLGQIELTYLDENGQQQIFLEDRPWIFAIDPYVPEKPNTTGVYCGDPCSGDSGRNQIILADSCAGPNPAQNRQTIEDIYVNESTPLMGSIVTANVSHDCRSSDDHSNIWYFNGEQWFNETYYDPDGVCANTGNNNPNNFSIQLTLNGTCGTQYIRGIIMDNAEYINGSCINSSGDGNIDDLAFNVTCAFQSNATGVNVVNSSTDNVVVNDSDLMRWWSEQVYGALWNETDTAFLEHNGTGTLINYTIDPPYTNNWTNVTLPLANVTQFSAPGAVNFRIWDNDTTGLWNVTGWSTYNIFGGARVVNQSVNNSNVHMADDGTDIQIACAVDDNETNTAVANYQVQFSRNGSLLGPATTDANGNATYNHAVEFGIWNYSCSVNDNTAVNYIGVGATADTAVYVRELVNANGSSTTTVDRDGAGPDDDSVTLYVGTYDPVGSIPIRIYINLTDPSGLGQTGINIGQGMANATGQLQYTWDPNSSVYPGNYTWYARHVGDVYRTNGTGWFQVIGSNSPDFVQNFTGPERWVKQNDIITVAAMFTESTTDDDAVNTSYNMDANFSLIDPAGDYYNTTPLIFRNSTAAYTPPWWNDSYSLRARLNITNNDNYPINSNYTINFTMDTTGANFQADGDDVRVVYWDGNNNIELDRYQEGSWNSASSIIAFSLQSLIFNGSFDDKSYYVYYSNPDADTPLDNGSNVYWFYDDFNSGLLSDRVTINPNSTGTWQLIGGELVAGDPDSTSDNMAYYHPKNFTSDGRAIDIRIRSKISTNTDDLTFIHLMVHPDDWTSYDLRTKAANERLIRKDAPDALTATLASNATGISSNTWYQFSATIDGADIKGYREGAAIAVADDSTYREGYVGFSCESSSTESCFWDELAGRYLVDHTVNLLETENQTTLLALVGNATLAGDAKTGTWTVEVNASADYFYDSTGTTTINVTSDIQILEYGGNTTNLLIVEDLESVEAFTIDKPGIAKIVWQQPLNLSGQLDIASALIIGTNSVELIPAAAPVLNSPANISLYNVNWSNPVMLRNTVECVSPQCENMSHSPVDRVLNFSVQSFSTYSSGENSTLGAIDQSDAEFGFENHSVGEIVSFYANYTAGVPLASATCLVQFDTGSGYGPFNPMTYVTGLQMYQFNASFGLGGNHTFNITCYEPGYNNLSVEDDFLYFLFDMNGNTAPATIYGNDTMNIYGTINLTNIGPINESAVNISINGTAYPRYWFQKTFQYGKEIVISEQSGGALTEYQVNVTLDTETLINDGELRSDCLDMIVADGEDDLLPFVMPLGRRGCDSNETIIWIQVEDVPANGEEIVYLYYGNSSYTNDNQDLLETFNYSAPKNLYFPVTANHDVTTQVIGYQNGTSVATGGYADTLTQGVSSNLTATDIATNVAMKSDGPISIHSSGNADMWAPISFAATEFVGHIERGAGDFHILPLWGSIDVEFWDGNASIENLSVSNGTIGSTSATPTVRNSVRLNGTGPFLLVHEDAANDIGVVPPPATNLWNIHSQRFSIGTLYDDTLVNIYYSNGSSLSMTMDKGTFWRSQSSQSQGVGAQAIHIESSKPISAGMWADGDGSEMTFFWPEEYLSHEYFIPDQVDFISIAAPNISTSCTAYDAVTGGSLGSDTGGTQPHPYPQELFIDIGDQDNVRLVCTDAVFIFADGFSQDERNVMNPIQARQFVYPEPKVVIRDLSLRTDATGLYNLSLTAPAKGIYNITINTSYSNRSNFTWAPMTIQDKPPIFNHSFSDTLIYMNETFSYDVNCTDPIDHDTIVYYDNTSIFDINSGTGIISYPALETDARKHTINITCEGDVNNTGDSFVLQVMDNHSPRIEYSANISANNSMQNRDWVYVSVDITEANFNNVSFDFAGSNGSVRTDTFTDATRDMNYSNLDSDEQEYWYNVTTYDTFNNSNQTFNYSVMLDEQIPRLDWLGSPANNSFYQQDWFAINITWNETYYSNTTFWLYNRTGALISSLNVSDGRNGTNVSFVDQNTSYRINVTLRDIAGNINTTSYINFTLDNTSPSIDYAATTLLNSTFHSKDWIYIGIDIMEVNVENITYRLFNDVTGSENDSTTYGTSTLIHNFTSLNSNGSTYYFNVTIYDKVNNSNVTFTRNVTLDNVNPTLDYAGVTPTNNTFLSQDWFMVQIDVDDATLANFTFDMYNGLSGAVNDSVTHLNGSLFHNFSNIDSDGDIYYFNVTARDEGENNVSLITRNITLDNTIPGIRLVSPSNNSNLSQDWLMVTVEVNESTRVNVSFFLYNALTGTTNRSQTYNDTTTISHNFTGLNANGSIYYFNASVTDAAGNYNESETWNVTLDKHAPNITWTADNVGDNTYWNRTWIREKVLASDATFKRIDFELYSDAGLLSNQSYSDGTREHNFTGISSNLTFYLNVTAYDIAGNNHSVAVRTVTHDSALPYIAYNANTSATDGFQTVDWFYLSVSVYDDTFSNITFSLYNGTTLYENHTFTTVQTDYNFTNIGANTTYFYNVTVQDLVNHSNVTDRRNFTFDNTTPTIHYELPTEPNLSRQARDWIFINVTIDEVNYSNMTFWLWNNSDGSYVNSANYSDATREHNFTGLSDSEYRINVTARDRAGNTNDSITRINIVDLSPPELSYISPTLANNTRNFVNWMYINASVNDTLQNVTSCNLQWDNSTDVVNYSMTVIGAGAQVVCARNMTALNNATTYTYRVYANDTVNNTLRGPIIVNIENDIPRWTNVSLNATRAKLGTDILVTSVGASDADGDTIELRCGDTSGNYNLCNSTFGAPQRQCSFANPWDDDANHSVYCITNDSYENSDEVSVLLEADNTPPANGSITSVASDITVPYYDDSPNNNTLIVLDIGENLAECRWDTTAGTWSSRNTTNDCSAGGSTQQCQVNNSLPSEALNYIRYVSCRDQYGNEQNAANNTVVNFSVDYTEPTTYDSHPGGIVAPPYNVTIYESDAPGNLSKLITTNECEDFTNTCNPTTPVDNFDNVTFSVRGTNYLRYYSNDSAGHIQTPNKSTTIIVNTLPIVSVPDISDDYPDTNIVDHTPALNWTYYDFNSQSQTMYHVQVSTLPNGGGTMMWDTGQVVSAVSSITYAGSALVDNNTYWVRVRVNDSLEFSAWNQTNFTMNALPNSTTNVTPVPANTTDSLICTNSTLNDSNGDTPFIQRYYWYNNSVQVDNDNRTLLQNYTRKHEIWHCGMVINDTHEINEILSGQVAIWNTPPNFTGVIPNQTWQKNVNHFINISPHWSDVDGDALNYTTSALTGINILIDNVTGNITFVPDTNFTGQRTVTFTANDSDNTTTTHVVNLTVYGITVNMTVSNTSPMINQNFTIKGNINWSNGSPVGSHDIGIYVNDTRLYYDAGNAILVNFSTGVNSTTNASGGYHYVYNIQEMEGDVLIVVNVTDSNVTEKNSTLMTIAEAPSNLAITSILNDSTYVAHQAGYFYANYSDVNQAWINDSKVNCSIRFNETGTYGGWNVMTYNTSTQLFTYFRNFTQVVEDGAYRVVCDRPYYLKQNTTTNLVVNYTTTGVAYPSGFTAVVDRDRNNSVDNDTINLTVHIPWAPAGLTIDYYANVTDPVIASEINISLGSATTNGTGHATLTWDPNGTTYYAGQYEWYANHSTAKPSTTNGTDTLNVMGAVNITYTNATLDPTASYTQTQTVEIALNITSPGKENRSELNTTFGVEVNVTFIDPSNNTRNQIANYSERFPEVWNSSYLTLTSDEAGVWELNISAGNSSYHYPALSYGRQFQLRSSTQLVSPPNSTDVDRDEQSGSISDTIELVANITGAAPGDDVYFTVSLIRPNVSNQFNITVGINQTNASGFASYLWNPNSTDVFAGTYEWRAWANNSDIVTNRTLDVIGSANVSFDHDTDYPNATYDQNQSVWFTTTVDSFGPENRSYLDHTYNLTLNITINTTNASSIIRNTIFNGTTWNVTYNISETETVGPYNMTLNASAIKFDNPMLNLSRSFIVMGLTNLTTNDTSDHIVQIQNQTIIFDANFSDVQQAPITDGNCSIAFNVSGTWSNLTNMTYTAGIQMYRYSRNFSFDQDTAYWVACSRLYYNYQNVTGMYIVNKSYLTILEPANFTLLDRNESNAIHPDETEIVVRLERGISNHMVTFKANMTDPFGSFTNVTLGQNLTNSSGEATLLFNPNGTMYAGRYSFFGWSNTTFPNQTVTVDVYGSMNATYASPIYYPNQTYSPLELLEVYANVTSDGRETVSEINTTYNPVYNVSVNRSDNSKIELLLINNGTIWYRNYTMTDVEPVGNWYTDHNFTADYFFNVTGLTRNFAVFGYSFLTFWDETNESGRPAWAYSNTTFKANFTNKSEMPIEGANCTAQFDDVNLSMGFEPGAGFYQVDRRFNGKGTYDYNISCTTSYYFNQSGVDNLLVQDEAYITSTYKLINIGPLEYNLTINLTNELNRTVVNVSTLAYIPETFDVSYGNTTDTTLMTRGAYPGTIARFRTNLSGLESQIVWVNVSNRTSYSNPEELNLISAQVEWIIYD